MAVKTMVTAMSTAATRYFLSMPTYRRRRAVFLRDAVDRDAVGRGRSRPARSRCRRNRYRAPCTTPDRARTRDSTARLLVTRCRPSPRTSPSPSVSAERSPDVSTSATVVQVPRAQSPCRWPDRDQRRLRLLSLMLSDLEPIGESCSHPLGRRKGSRATLGSSPRPHDRPIVWRGP